MINEYSKEIQDYVKSKLLKPGDQVMVTYPDKSRAFSLGEETPTDSSTMTFKGHPETYRGHLLASPAEHGAEPGVYLDRSKVSLEDVNGIQISADLDDIALDPDLFVERLTTLSPNNYFINPAADMLRDLPETTHMEGDIVALIDKDHPKFSANQDDNQFTIYRVYYETAATTTTIEKTPTTKYTAATTATIEKTSTTKYRLRAGAAQFDVTEDQIQFLSAGPVRLFYGGEGYKLIWGRMKFTPQAVKAEAEFYLLLGRFNKIYNSANKSYYWDLAQANQMILEGQGHAILQYNLDFYLVNFWDSDIGSQLSPYPEIILDI